MTTHAAADPLPWGDGPCSTRRHGTTLTTCDSEPVQAPGCVQAHGALLVLRLGDLRVLHSSENTLQHLGEEAAQPPGRPVGRVEPAVPVPQGRRLSPRASFEMFVDSVLGRSLPWSEVETDAALRLRLLVLVLVITFYFTLPSTGRAASCCRSGPLQTL